MTQCILTGDCIKTVEALDLTTESTVEIVGKVEKVKDGQTAPGGVEIIVDYWRIIGLAPGGKEAFESIIQPVCPIPVFVWFLADGIGYGQLKAS
jgi:asparaginyl-tRNA synthetase